MSSYLDIFRSILKTAVEIWPEKRMTSSFMSDFISDLRRFGFVSSVDITTVLFFAVFLTCLRWVLSRFLLKPLAIKMGFTAKNVIKFPESCWKCFYYLTMYIYACYLLFGTQYMFYKTPRTCWTDWSIGMNIPSNIYYLYAIQTSFYLHSIYATFYMDPWRNDSIAMILHHVLTVSLLTFSFAVRYYKIGVVVLFLHDLCDVLLEATKILVCFKTRNNQQYNWPEPFINMGFIAFTFSWLYFRLYLYPYKVLYPCGHYAIYMHPYAPFYYFFNTMLFFLFSMNLYWFHFIVLLLWRVAAGQSREVEDTRELQGMQKTKDKIYTSERNVDINDKDTIVNTTADHMSSNGNYYHQSKEIENEDKLNNVDQHATTDHEKAD